MAEEKNLPDEQTLPTIDIPDEEFDEYINSLDELTLLEASSLKREVDNAIRQWKLCRDTLSNLDNPAVNDKLNSSIREANLLETVNVDTREKFESDYETNINRLEKIAEKLLAIIDEHKDEIDSTVYMTQQMIVILTKRLKALPKDDPNYELELKVGNRILDSFTDRLTGSRETINWIGEKLIHYIRTHRKEISKSLREETKLVLHNERTKAIKDLGRQFSENSIAKAMYYLSNIFNDRVDQVIIFTNFLAHVLRHGKDSGDDSYAKLVILDLIDIYNGIYDVPDYSRDEYLEYFYNSVVHPMSDFLLRGGKRKIVVLPPESNYGLLKPIDEPAEFKEEISLESINEKLEEVLQQLEPQEDELPDDID